MPSSARLTRPRSISKTSAGAGTAITPGIDGALIAPLGIAGGVDTSGDGIPDIATSTAVDGDEGTGGALVVFGKRDTSGVSVGMDMKPTPPPGLDGWRRPWGIAERLVAGADAGHRRQLAW